MLDMSSTQLSNVKLFCDFGLTNFILTPPDDHSFHMQIGSTLKRDIDYECEILHIEHFLLLLLLCRHDDKLFLLRKFCYTIIANNGAIDA